MVHIDISEHPTRWIFITVQLSFLWELQISFLEINKLLFTNDTLYCLHRANIYIKKLTIRGSKSESYCVLTFEDMNEPKFSCSLIIIKRFSSLWISLSKACKEYWNDTISAILSKTVVLMKYWMVEGSMSILSLKITTFCYRILMIHSFFCDCDILEFWVGCSRNQPLRNFYLCFRNTAFHTLHHVSLNWRSLLQYDYSIGHTKRLILKYSSSVSTVHCLRFLSIEDIRQPPTSLKNNRFTTQAKRRLDMRREEEKSKCWWAKQ